MPEGIVCSPHATMPMPPPSSRPPTTMVSRHSRRVGRMRVPPPRAIDQVRRMAPAITNRMAAIRNGGMVSTATAIPR